MRKKKRQLYNTKGYDRFEVFLNYHLKAVRELCKICTNCGV